MTPSLARPGNPPNLKALEAIAPSNEAVNIELDPKLISFDFRLAPIEKSSWRKKGEQVLLIVSPATANRECDRFVWGVEIER